MPDFNKTSILRLEQCAQPLQMLFKAVVKTYDCTVLCGHRTEVEQRTAFLEKTSKLDWPNSKHNQLPSLAIDVAPYPIDWNDIYRFYFFAGIVYSKAQAIGIADKLRWGGDWDGNGKFSNETFKDLVHWELIK